MRKFHCSCNNTLYFDNTRCDACGREVGFCPACQTLVDLVSCDSSSYHCGNKSCGAGLIKCHNYVEHEVCNRCVAVPSDGAEAESFCGCCRYNTVIPNLGKVENLNKWRRIEAAKRRVFYQLDLLGLPHGKAHEGFDPPLSFEFKENLDTPLSHGATGISNGNEIVMTGHKHGTITINICEADPVERERLRVQFGEAHRSLIGHFRHELAHYYWDLLIKGRDELGFTQVFGDHNAIPYAEAMQRYYQQGPPPNWQNSYPSTYATMHPWEDFAESFTTYLEMVGTLDTAYHLGLGGPGVYVNLDEMVAAYSDLGVALNEINRTMGLKDLLSRPLVGPVIDKLRYVHQMIQATREHPTRLQDPSPLTSPDSTN